LDDAGEHDADRLYRLGGLRDPASRQAMMASLTSGSGLRRRPPRVMYAGYE
jgi:hypothetical protein